MPQRLTKKNGKVKSDDFKVVKVISGERPKGKQRELIISYQKYDKELNND